MSISLSSIPKSTIFGGAMPTSPTFQQVPSNIATDYSGAYNQMTNQYQQDAGALTGKLAALGMFGSSNAGNQFQQLNYGLGQAQSNLASQQANQNFSNQLQLANQNNQVAQQGYNNQMNEYNTGNANQQQQFQNQNATYGLQSAQQQQQFNNKMAQNSSALQANAQNFSQQQTNYQDQLVRNAAKYNNGVNTPDNQFNSYNYQSSTPSLPIYKPYTYTPITNNINNAFGGGF